MHGVLFSGATRAAPTLQVTEQQHSKACVLPNCSRHIVNNQLSLTRSSNQNQVLMIEAHPLQGKST
jgi:hypothetical protein